MEETINTVKALSPYGWGITVFVLLLNMYTDKSPFTSTSKEHLAEYNALKDRVIILEKEFTEVQSTLYTINNSLSDVVRQNRDLKKIGCIGLTRPQRDVASICGG